MLREQRLGASLGDNCQCSGGCHTSHPRRCLDSRGPATPPTPCSVGLSLFVFATVLRAARAIRSQPNWTEKHHTCSPVGQPRRNHDHTDADNTLLINTVHQTKSARSGETQREERHIYLPLKTRPSWTNQLRHGPSILSKEPAERGRKARKAGKATVKFLLYSFCLLFLCFLFAFVRFLFLFSFSFSFFFFFFVFLLFSSCFLLVLFSLTLRFLFSLVFSFVFVRFPVVFFCFLGRTLHRCSDGCVLVTMCHGEVLGQAQSLNVVPPVPSLLCAGMVATDHPRELGTHQWWVFCLWAVVTATGLVPLTIVGLTRGLW